MGKFQCNFISYTLQRTVDITVVIPSATIPESMGRNMGSEAMGAMPNMPKAATHQITEPYPVLYLLHGMGNNHTGWTAYTNVEMFAEERNIAVVMISGENKSYVNHESGDRFYDFIQDELPEFICNFFPVSSKQEDTYIAGLSMGGFGAYVHALSRPDKYAAFGAFSAAVALNPASISGGTSGEIKPEFDPKSLLIQLKEKGLTPPKAYISCGDQDFLYKDNQAFVQMFREYDYDCTWIDEPGFGHEWRFWHNTVEEFLDWLPRTDAYSKEKKRQI